LDKAFLKSDSCQPEGPGRKTWNFPPSGK